MTFETHATSPVIAPATLDVVEYTRANLDALPTALTNVSAAQRAYLVACVRRQPSALVRDSLRTLSLLVVNGKVVPVSVGVGTHPQDDKVAQMLKTIASEARRILQPPALAVSTAMFYDALCAAWSARSAMATVTLNDWLDGHIGKEPTGLSGDEWAKVWAFVEARHRRAVFTLGVLESGRGTFEALGFRWLRMSDHFDLYPAVGVSKTLRSDRSAIRKGEFELRRASSLTDDELDRVRTLYLALNVGKYKGPLPLYEPAWFRLLLDSGVGTIYLVRRGGRIEAFSLHYDWGHSPKSPSGHLVIGYTGYDPDASASAKNMPRFVYNPPIERALAENKHFSMGSGNAQFKGLRGGVADDAWCVGVRAQGLSIVERGLLRTVLDVIHLTLAHAAPRASARGKGS